MTKTYNKGDLGYYVYRLYDRNILILLQTIATDKIGLETGYVFNITRGVQELWSLDAIKWLTGVNAKPYVANPLK